MSPPRSSASTKRSSSTGATSAIPSQPRGRRLERERERRGREEPVAAAGPAVAGDSDARRSPRLRSTRRPGSPGFGVKSAVALTPLGSSPSGAPATSERPPSKRTTPSLPSPSTDVLISSSSSRHSIVVTARSQTVERRVDSDRCRPSIGRLERERLVPRVDAVERSEEREPCELLALGWTSRARRGCCARPRRGRRALSIIRRRRATPPAGRTEPRRPSGRPRRARGARAPRRHAPGTRPIASPCAPSSSSCDAGSARQPSGRSSRRRAVSGRANGFRTITSRS